MNLYTECVTKKDDILYFVSIDSNFIFSFDLNTRETNIVASIEEEQQFERRLFGEILTWGDKFVLVPANAKNVWIVDASFSNWEKIELQYPDISLKFLCAKIVDDELYMFKHLYPYTVCLNLKTREKSQIETGTDFFTGVDLYKGTLYFGSCNSNRLYAYEIRNKMLQTYLIDITNMSGINNIGGKFYITTREGNGIAELSCDISHLKKIDIQKALAVFENNNSLYIPTWSKDEKPEKQFVILNNNTFAKKIAEGCWCMVDRDANVQLYDNSDYGNVSGKLCVTREQLPKSQVILENGGIYEESTVFDVDEFVGLLKANKNGE